MIKQNTQDWLLSIAINIPQRLKTGFNDFWHKIKIYNFDPYNVFLSIAINIPQLKTKYPINSLRQFKRGLPYLS